MFIIPSCTEKSHALKSVPVKVFEYIELQHIARVLNMYIVFQKSDSE